MKLNEMIPHVKNATKELSKLNQELAIALALYKELRDLMNDDSDKEAIDKIAEVTSYLHEETTKMNDVLADQNVPQEN